MNHYVVIFISLLFGGETVLIPAIYLTLIDVWSVPAVIGIALAATIISDSWWYLLGRRLPMERIRRLRPFRNRQQALERGGRLFRRYGLWCILLSKFVYGTRIAVQIFSGIERIPYLLYTLVNTVAVASWIAVLYLVGIVLRHSIGQFEESVTVFQYIFAGFFLLVIGVLLWINHALSKKWFQ